MIKKTLLILFIISIVFASKNADANENNFQCSLINLVFLSAIPCGPNFSFFAPFTQSVSVLVVNDIFLSGIIKACYSESLLKDV